MLNPDRVILMTHMEAYAEGEGKKYIKIGKYFRGDYVGKEVLKSLIYTSAAYILALGLYILYDLENLMQEFYTMDLMSYAQRIIFWYVILIAAETVITYIVYSIRFQRAKKSLKNYYANLKKLNSLYEEQGG